MAELSEKERQAQLKAAGKARVQRLKDEAKAKRKADKERKRTTTNPREMGRLRQIQQAYKLTHEYDKALPWLLIAAFVIPLAVFLAIGFAVSMPIILGLLGISIGLLCTTIVLTRRVKRATFLRYQGQAGSAEVALNLLGKSWTTSPAIAVTKHKDVVHRAVGRGGVVLIGEGDPGRVRKLLDKEQRTHEKFTEAVVTTVVMGERANEVPLSQLTRHIEKLPKVLEKYEVQQVTNRLRAIDASRPKMPIPRGPMPTTRGSRRAMRG